MSSEKGKEPADGASACFPQTQPKEDKHLCHSAQAFKIHTHTHTYIYTYTHMCVCPQHLNVSKTTETEAF